MEAKGTQMIFAMGMEEAAPTGVLAALLLAAAGLEEVRSSSVQPFGIKSHTSTPASPRDEIGRAHV